MDSPLTATRETPPVMLDNAGKVPQVGNGFPPPTNRKDPGELDDEQLAEVVSNGLVKLAVDSERLKPYFFELRERFHKKSAASEIHGCRSWDEFCTTILKRTRRAVNYLLAGGNPASKRNSENNGTAQQGTGSTPVPENGLPPFAISHSPIDGDIGWSKQDASRRMLAWNMSCVRTFSPSEKREVVEDMIAKLRDEMEFEAPQPPLITGEPVPEPDSGTLEELRQEMARMADTEEIKKALEKALTELVIPLLERHPYKPSHTVYVRVDRPEKQRVVVGDWVEYTGQGEKRLREQIGNDQPCLRRVVGEDQLERPRIRWNNGTHWMKPYSLFHHPEPQSGFRVLFDWQAAEKYPQAFGSYREQPATSSENKPQQGAVAPEEQTAQKGER